MIYYVRARRAISCYATPRNANANANADTNVYVDATICYDRSGQVRLCHVVRCGIVVHHCIAATLYLLHYIASMWINVCSTFASMRYHGFRIEITLYSLTCESIGLLDPEPEITLHHVTSNHLTFKRIIHIRMNSDTWYE